MAVREPRRPPEALAVQLVGRMPLRMPLMSSGRAGTATGRLPATPSTVLTTSGISGRAGTPTPGMAGRAGMGRAGTSTFGTATLGTATLGTMFWTADRAPVGLARPDTAEVTAD